jgi:hypothetical protein
MIADRLLWRTRRKRLASVGFCSHGIGPMELVRCSAATASMTAADLVTGILRRTGGMPIRAPIGRHRLISLAVRPLNRARAKRAWLAWRVTWASEREPKLAMPPPPPAALPATVTLRSVAVPSLNRPPPRMAVLPATVTLVRARSTAVVEQAAAQVGPAAGDCQARECQRAAVMRKTPISHLVNGPRALPMERCPGGVEDVAANQGAVTLDRHAAQRCAAVVEEPSAHQGTGCRGW